MRLYQHLTLVCHLIGLWFSTQKCQGQEEGAETACLDAAISVVNLRDIENYPTLFLHFFHALFGSSQMFVLLHRSFHAVLGLFHVIFLSMTIISDRRCAA